MATTTETTPSAAPAAPTVNTVITAHGTRLFQSLGAVEADISILASHIEPTLITSADALDQKSIQLLQAAVPKLQKLHSALQTLINKTSESQSSSTSPAAATQ